MSKIDISKLDPFAGDSPPMDDKLIDLLKQAYQDQIPVHVTMLEIESIKPFSDYKPPYNEQVVDIIEKRLTTPGNPLPLYVYFSKGKFIMSDDYYTYHVHLSLNSKRALCIILGEFDHNQSGVLVKPEPIELKTPESAEVINN
ncbi:MAG: hypothetical protein OEX81_03410 [Candidatus Pacebacteria bacterium]|nr:hypothetical protein [Candidatus Paceibacterota bacterium]